MTITIPLTQGQITVVDDEFVDLAHLNWCAIYKPEYGKDGAFVAGRTVAIGGRRTRTILLHREIMGRIVGRKLARHEQVDHIDVNPLNNTVANLRLATQSQNSRNRPRQKNNASGFKGVTWRRDRGKWQAQIGHHRKVIHLGLFDDPEEAHQAYCRAADELHKEFKNYG